MQTCLFSVDDLTKRVNARRICTVEGCDRPAYYRLFCHMHYARNKKNTGHVGPAEPIKKRHAVDAVCKVEGCERTLKSQGPRGNGGGGRGLCAMHYQRLVRRGHHGPADLLRKPNPGVSRRDKHYRKLYGMTLAEYEEMSQNQGGVCAICGEPPAEDSGRGHGVLVVDHCHTNGHVRGLLCATCNLAIGYLKDNPDILLSATQYLLKDANLLKTL
jgi:hypothetical protein